MLRYTTHRVELLLLAGFLLLSLLVDGRGLDPETPDSETYLTPARQLFAGQGYTAPGPDGDPRPDVHRSPGYPLFLLPWLLFGRPAALLLARWIQRLLLALVLLLAPPPVAARQGGQRRLAALGKGLVLLSPVVLLNASFLLSDALFVALLGAGLLALRRTLDSLTQTPPAPDRLLLRRATLAASCLGLATLTRPAGLWLLPWLLLLALPALLRTRPRLPRRRILLAAAVLLLVYACFPLSWSLRNGVQTGHFAFSPLAGYNLSLHRLDRLTAGAVADQPGITAVQRALLAELRAGHHVAEARQTVARALRLDEFTIDAAQLDLARRAIRLEPLAYLRDSLVGALNLFLSPMDDFLLLGTLLGDRPAFSTPLAEAVAGRRVGTVALHLFIRGYHLLLYLALPCLLLLTARRRYGLRAALVYLGAGLYFTALTALLIPVQARFLLPLLPSLLFLYAPPLPDAP